MKVFVTGGTGFVGAHLVRRLIEHGFGVRCLVRGSSRRDNLRGLPVELTLGDVRDLDSLRRAIKGCQVVYHCAADYRFWLPDPQEMYDNNVKGTANVMQVCHEAGVERVIYTSTTGALGMNKDGSPANEQTPVSLDDMVGHYKRSKFLAEREAEKWAQKGLPVVIVNPSTPVGELDIKPTPTGKMIVDFCNRKMVAYVDTGMNIVDVRDVAEGHILAAQKGRVGEKYILGNRNMTLKEIFDLLSQITGIHSPKLCVPHWIPMLVASFENFYSIRIARREPQIPLESVKLSRYKMFFDPSKAVRELGLPQTPVEQALERAVKWFKDNGYVRPA